MALSTGATWALGLGIAAAAGLFLYSERDALTKLAPASKSNGRGPGWYALLFNYPKGHGDRRMKSFNGPFASKAVADDYAEGQKDSWYPLVKHLNNDPLTLEEREGWIAPTTAKRSRRR